MSPKKLFKLGCVLCAMVAGPWSANAVLIDGGISFAGGFTADNPNLMVATTIVSFSDVEVTSVSGTFAAEGITAGDTVVMLAPIVFDPLPGSWVNPIWSVGGFSFALDNIVEVERDSFVGLTALEIKGLGTMSHPDYEDTPGALIFTGNSARGTLSFSASSQSPPERVPDSGNPAILLGIMLAGLGLIRRFYPAAH
jgi:hypothetical protein